MQGIFITEKDSLHSLILKFKYSDRSFRAKTFGLSIYETMNLHSFYNDVGFIMPVPLNIVRGIKRGYNHVEPLANEISIKVAIPILGNALFRKKITNP
jgi:predicted amidophosphoribosyltransferase